MSDRPLLELIDSFQRATYTTDSALSRRLGCHPRQVSEMREGRVPRTAVDARIRTYIAERVALFHREFPQ